MAPDDDPRTPPPHDEHGEEPPTVPAPGDAEADTPAPDLMRAADMSHLVSDAAEGSGEYGPAGAAGRPAWQNAGDAAWEAAAHTAPALTPAELGRSRRALAIWLAILCMFGAGGVLFGQQELAMLVAISGVVIAAHAADYHPRFELTYRLASAALIGFGGAVLVALGAYLYRAGLTGPAGEIVPLLSIVSGVFVFATGIPVVARGLAGLLFGARGDSHGYRLATRLTVLTFLIATPGWFATQTLLDDPDQMHGLFSRLTLGSGVFGYVILALASTGFLVRRDVHSTLERLGLTRFRRSYVLWIVAGVPLLFALNAAGEWGQKHWFPSLWDADQRVNDALSGALSKPMMVAVAFTAGIGEEITMRGALQPKLGIVLTSLFFAALHVQYSWYGMAMIFAFGMLLGAIRVRTNTVVVMVIHFLYDLLALLAQ